MPKERKPSPEQARPLPEKPALQVRTQGQDKSPSDEILAAEYTHLIALYTHTENTLYSIFNFYVTLLTTITGAIVLLTQVFPTVQTSLQRLILPLLVFTILLGLIIQDALIHKNVDLAQYTLAINVMKFSLSRQNPRLQRQLFYLANLHATVNPFKEPVKFYERMDKIFWWIVPLGMPQLFVSVINSMALAGIMILTTLGISIEPLPPWKLILGGLVTTGVTYIAHCIYAKTKFQQVLQRAAKTVDGQPYQWSEKS